MNEAAPAHLALTWTHCYFPAGAVGTTRASESPSETGVGGGAPPAPLEGKAVLTVVATFTDLACEPFGVRGPGAEGQIYFSRMLQRKREIIDWNIFQNT